MDRRTLIALILCLLIPITWQKLVQQYYPNQISSQTSPQTTSGSPPLTQINPSTTQPAREHSQIQKSTRPALRPSQKMKLHTSIGDVVIGDSQYFFEDWGLKSYKLGISPQAAAVDLQSVTHQNGALNLAFEDPSLAYLNEVQGNLTATPEGAVWEYEDENVKLKREFIASENQPYVDVRISTQFKSNSPKFAFVSLTAQSYEKDPEAQDRQLIYWTNQSLERVQLKDDVKLSEISSPVKYIAASNRYFIASAVAQGPVQPNGLIQGTGVNSGRISLVYPLSGSTTTIPIRTYFGPKELDLLRKVDPTLDHTIDFGWFTVFAYPLLTTLKWLHQFLQNYGVAIIVLTLLLKLATYPLTYKSMKSMKKMAKLQPQLQKLRDKYKDDKEALNREMLTIMKTQGYNPMAGCLPLLIQMPIFFALYRVLYSSIELYHAPFMFWIKDLSSHDPFYVTPVLLTLTMFIQQKLTPNTATDPAQAKMMQFMPLMFGAFMLALPAGLTIYMLVNALASIAQQLILNKRLNEPAHATP